MPVTAIYVKRKLIRDNLVDQAAAKLICSGKQQPENINRIRY